jgi:hypothetical protein
MKNLDLDQATVPQNQVNPMQICYGLQSCVPVSLCMALPAVVKQSFASGNA